jgi:hypothetical protein
MLLAAPRRRRRGDRRPPDRLPPGRPELGRPGGARTNHLCLDLYDLPLIPHRVGGGARRRGALRDPEGECPWCRPRAEEARRASASSGRTPRPSRSRHGAPAPRSRSGSSAPSTRRISAAPDDAAVRGHRAGAAHVLGGLAASLDGPPYNLVSTPRRCRSGSTARSTGTGRSTPGCREIAGPRARDGLPVNPVSPEAAVEELLERAGAPIQQRGERASHTARARRHLPRRRRPPSILLGRPGGSFSAGKESIARTLDLPIPRDSRSAVPVTRSWVQDDARAFVDALFREAPLGDPTRTWCGCCVIQSSPRT